MAGIKTAMKCEVCNDRLGRQNQSIQVGRKLNGVPREIHDRARCRKRWAESGGRLRAGWPETGLENARAAAAAAAVAKESPVPPAPEGLRLLVRKPRSVGTTERPSTVTVTPEQASALDAGVRPEHSVRYVKPAAPVKEEPMAVSIPVPIRKARHHWKLKPELVEEVLRYFSRNPYKTGASGKLWAILDATRPELLLDLDGHSIGEPTLSTQVTKILRDAKGAAVQQLATMAGVEERVPPAYPDLRPAVEKAAALVAGILALAAAGDVDTLATLEDLMRGPRG